MDSTQLQQRYREGDRNFQGIDLANANLAWLELEAADLRGANFNRTNLSGANLIEANLSGATNLSFADLSRADLSHADLRGTNLQGANLSGVTLKDAVYDQDTQFPIGFDPSAMGATSAKQQVHANATAIEEPIGSIDLEREAAASENEDLSQYVTQVSPKERQRDRPRPPKRRSKPISPETEGTIAEISAAIKKTALWAEAGLQDVSQQVSQRWTEERQPSKQAASSPPHVADDRISSASGKGRNSIVPSEIKGWNWGAFLFPYFWFITNQVWGGIWLWVLSLIPGVNIITWLCYSLVFGLNGNEYAWKARSWKSIEQFKRHQRYWAIASFLLIGLYVLIVISS